jgi:uncharacterized membrane protein YhdT
VGRRAPTLAALHPLPASGRMDDITNFEIWFVLTVIVTPVVWYVIVKAINRSETPTVE